MSKLSFYVYLSRDKSTSLADERSTRMEEVLSEMRFLKMNTWEDAFLHLINRIRR